MSDLPPHDRFPYGLDPERPRPWLDDDDKRQCPACGRTWDDACLSPEGTVYPWCEPEPERLRCRSCGGIWDEPKLNADGVCPTCVLELNER